MIVYLVKKLNLIYICYKFIYVVTLFDVGIKFIFIIDSIY